MPIQAIIFQKKYWDLNKVHDWLKNNDYHPIKAIHETENFYRARLVKPTFKNYYTKKKRPHIEYIIGY